MPAPSVAALASSSSPTVFGPAVPAPPRPLAAPVAPGVIPPAASTVALSAPIDAKLSSPVLEAQRQLMARLLALWGVRDASADRVLAAWPTLPDGSLDIAGTAARYQLAATYLPSTSLADLRAIGLPALVELADAPAGRPYLLRSIGAETAALISPSGEEARFALNSLDPAWTRSAWIVWRNVDQLPPDPWQAMNAVLHQVEDWRRPMTADSSKRCGDSRRRWGDCRRMAWSVRGRPWRSLAWSAAASARPSSRAAPSEPSG